MGLTEAMAGGPADPRSEAGAGIGVVGLGVMGANLALNLADHGAAVAVYNRSAERAEAFLAGEAARQRAVSGHRSLESLIAALARPRTVLVMVQAGAAVDAQIDALTPLLEAGDLVIDGGNAHYADTARRAEALAAAGLAFLGVGVSGGEVGARWGPAIMAGGDEAGYAHAAPLLEAIAAKVDGDPCCAWLGPGGAGHYVKMVHNGIEYALMQLIGEAWLMMRDGLGLAPEAIAAAFAGWADGRLGGYLVEITADILAAPDAETGGMLLDVIDDRAGHKGTGRWCAESALALGVPAATLAAGTLARSLSGASSARSLARRRLDGPETRVDDDIEAALADLEQALLAGFVTAFSEGFQLLDAASAQFAWSLDRARIAALWRGGCIIRARLLDDIRTALSAAPGTPLLAAEPAFAAALAEAQPGWRRTVARSVRHGLPAPAMASALAAYDSYRTERLWTALVQAQRDYFGAHTYRRIDRAGDVHTDWAALAGDG